MAGSQTITASIVADAKPFKKGVNDAVNATGALTKSLKGIGAAAAAAFSVTAITDFLFGAVKAADASRQINRSLATAVKNSKAFGATAQDIQKVTDQFDASSRILGEMIGIDDELINSIKRNWLSVGNISKTGVKGINKLALTAANVAAGTGKNFEAVATAFTKAFGDPNGAIAKLQKAGIVLNQNEKDRYDLLLKQGDQQKALAYLMDTLNNKFKGQAEAMASPFARLQVSWGNFIESVGGAFLPVIDKILPDLQRTLQNLANDPAFQKGLKDFADSIVAAIPKLVSFVDYKLPTLVKDFATIAKSVHDIVTPLNDFFSNPAVVTGLKIADKIGGLTPGNPLFMKNWGDVFTGKYFTQSTPNNAGSVQINVTSVSSSMETGRAVAQALDNYYRLGGRVISA